MILEYAEKIQELIGATGFFLGTLYGFFLFVPGEQPDKSIKKLLDITNKISRKKK